MKHTTNSHWIYNHQQLMLLTAWHMDQALHRSWLGLAQSTVTFLITSITIRALRKFHSLFLLSHHLQIKFHLKYAILVIPLLASRVQYCFACNYFFPLVLYLTVLFCFSDPFFHRHYQKDKSKIHCNRKRFTCISNHTENDQVQLKLGFHFCEYIHIKYIHKYIHICSSRSSSDNSSYGRCY